MVGQVLRLVLAIGIVYGVVLGGHFLLGINAGDADINVSLQWPLKILDSWQKMVGVGMAVVVLASMLGGRIYHGIRGK